MTEVDNRRTMCEHCSLRQDLPGFITAEHAQSNINRIKKGDFFPCHMSTKPAETHLSHRACLGAALVGGAVLKNAPSADLPPVYEDLESYKQAQAGARKSQGWLLGQQQWSDPAHRLWFGWWQQAPAGKWQYLMTTLEESKNGSAYLFFEHCEDLFGPLEKL